MSAAPRKPARVRLPLLRLTLALLVGSALVLGNPSPAGATVAGHNGKIVFVHSADRFHPAGDIWTVNPDGSGLTQLTSDSSHQDRDPAWSPDGSRIAFWRRPGATEFNQPVEAFLFVMNADGTNQQQLTFDDGGPFHADGYPAWSPDGSKILFVRNFRFSNPPCSELYVVNADGTDLHQLAPTPHCHEADPAWSPDGSKIAYTSYDDHPPSQPAAPPLFSANPDNTNPIRFYYGFSPSWQPAGDWITDSFENQIAIHPFDGPPSCCLGLGGPTLTGGNNPDWSPDSELIVGDSFPNNTNTQGLFTMNTAGGDRVYIAGTGGDDLSPAWQSLQPPPPADPGYPRPRGATPLVVSLVPASQECTSSSANTVHGPPLLFPSCDPPVQISPYLTIGTPDANGQRANSTGSVRVAAIAGDPSTPANEADVALSLILTDVRCMHLTLCQTTSPLAAYEGDLDVRTTLQITDRSPRSSAPGPSTFSPNDPYVKEPFFHFPASCAPTADPSVGSTCQGATTFNAIVPGAVEEGQRTIWELGQIQVFDGGAEGVAGASDAKLFADQGVFVP
jgi:hypothetical protein